VTVSNVSVSNDTTVTATFTITSGATMSARTVTVTKAGMTSNGVTFTVQQRPRPVITSISPTYGFRNSSTPVTINGSNFTGATSVTVSGSNVTVTNFSVVNDGQITATLNFTNTSTGNRNVRVVGGGGAGTSDPVTFLVEGQPAITSITPNTGVRGTNVNVAIVGTGFLGATGATIGGGDMSLTGFTVVDATHATATVVIGPTASTGGHALRITTPGGTSANVSNFTVQGPTLASISPNPAVRPASGSSVVTLTFTGTNLAGTTAVNGLATGNITIVAGSLTASANSVTVQINLPSNASTSNRSVSLTTNIGNTSTVVFHVQ
jgi:hypothetical protein